MGADVVSLDEARLRLRGESAPEADEDAPCRISDEALLAGEL
ncbi:hypothetical protein [Pseudonocardia endophytica]|uniref:Uncharacterized protein n=1 Tax=Pseudonocardia endophytica TaxID=401976 RepID=A0A4R1HPS9_PSEEN|nr:hypothetical protein [Pseudonocardia endophytica]TCK22440.1 hypothetical protein EV378_6442 [Pseudonocardia endophytica]